MKILLTSLLGLLLIGCASNPVLSGRPQDWPGHTADEMRSAKGRPTQILPQMDGSEIWIYADKGEFLAPQRESTGFKIGGGGGGGVFGASGGITTTKQGERITDYENVERFLIKSGKVRKWWAQRIVGGQIVWEDH